MAKIIDMKRMDSIRTSKANTLAHFAESELNKQNPDLVVRVKRFFGEIIGIRVIEMKKHQSKEVLKINLGYCIDNTKIESINVLDKNYLNTAKEFAEKYEKSLSEGREVVVYK